MLADGAQPRTNRARTAVVSENVPAWLNTVAEAGNVDNVTSSDDIVDEFLWNEDMLGLEVICMRWQGLDNSEVEALSKINPRLAESLVAADKSTSSFLSYRRKLQEKQNRKVQLKQAMKKRAAVEDIEEEDDDAADEESDEEEDEEEDDEDEEEDEEEEEPAPVSMPPPRGGRKTMVSGKVSLAPIETSKSGVLAADARKSMFARKKSVTAKNFQAQLSRLARVGTNILGQDDVMRTNTAKFAPDSPKLEKYRSSPTMVTRSSRSSPTGTNRS